MAWRVFDFQREHGNTTIKPPKVPRPPEVKVIWHNSFSDMLGKNKGPIEEQLASCAALLSSRKDLNFREVAAACGGLRDQHGRGRAPEPAHRPATAQCPTEPDFAGKLMVRDGANGALNVGSMSMTIIGPAKKDLENLRKDWNDWLQTVDGAKQVEGIRKRGDKDDDLLNSSEVGVQLGSLYAEADALAIALAKKLGNRKTGDTAQPGFADVPGRREWQVVAFDRRRSLAGHPGRTGSDRQARGGRVNVRRRPQSAAPRRGVQLGARVRPPRHCAQLCLLRQRLRGKPRTRCRSSCHRFASWGREVQEQTPEDRSEVQALVQLLVRGGRESEV